MTTVTITTKVTDVFVTKAMGMDGQIQYRPVTLSKLALASLVEYGSEPWRTNQFNDCELRKFGAKYGFDLNLYEDDEDFAKTWESFCGMMNGATYDIDQTCRDVDKHDF